MNRKPNWKQLAVHGLNRTGNLDFLYQLTYIFMFGYCGTGTRIHNNIDFECI